MKSELLSTEEQDRIVRAARSSAWAALPTVALALTVAAVWISTLAAALTSAMSWWLAVPLLGFEVYVAFTVLHEAAHGSLFRSARLNALTGHLFAPLFGPLASFSAYRFLHLTHHRHTNERDDDPDFWSGGFGPWWMLPLRWATQDVYYVYFYLKRGATRPLAERLEVGAITAVQLGAVAAATWVGYGAEVGLLWLVPSRIAATGLSLLFNYLPHLPYDVTARDAPHRATSMLTGPRWVLSPLTMWHDYHLVHHLYLGVPFYRYPGLWRALGPVLSARGVPQVAVFALPWRPRLTGEIQGAHSTSNEASLSSAVLADQSDEVLHHQAAQWVTEQRARCRALGEPLSPTELATYAPYFDRAMLESVRVYVTSHVENPPFVAELQAAGVPVPLDTRHIAGLTLVDTIVLLTPLLEARGGRRSVLFQELVHVEQYRRCGPEAFIGAYLASWNRGQHGHQDISFERAAELIRNRFDTTPERTFVVAEALEQILREPSTMTLTAGGAAHA